MNEQLTLMNGIRFHFTIHYKCSCFGLGLTPLSIIFHNIMKIMDFCSKRVLGFANLCTENSEKNVSRKACLSKAVGHT